VKTKPAAHYAFRLAVHPTGDGYALELLQAPAQGTDPDAAAFRPLARLGGDNLRAVVDQVLAALRHAGYRSSELSAARRAPFDLGETDGVRLALLFLAVRPLRKLARVEAVARGVAAMEAEELYYWFSKATADGEGRRARRAVRLLLAKE